MTVKSTSIQITRQLNSLESVLSKKLNAFFTTNATGDISQLETVKVKYGSIIIRLIREAVEEAWLFASTILAAAIGEQVFTSVKDIQGIEKLTNDLVQTFWNNAYKLKAREIELKLDKNSQFEEMEPFDVRASHVGLGAYIAYLAFNTGMESKADELSRTIRFRFTTKRDGAVDPTLCKPLEGKIFEAGNIPYFPPLHRHCRCHLIPIP